MLDKYLDLIENHLKRLVATIATVTGVTGLCLLVYILIQISTSKTDRPSIEEQPQTQAQSEKPSEEVESKKPFDRNQCKVYNLGLALGAWVFQYRGIDGKLNYILFTDNQEVVQTFDRTPFGISWWSSSGFRSSDYPEIAKVLPPEGLKELDSSLNHFSFAAIGTPAFAKAVQESHNAGLLDTCDVD
ncbi:hypothetical protein [Nostoc sp.]|uniref:hypothetical protein n=1 Tax=Nostoc sp. TaxID=1180 RepID=UPI002FFBA0F8